MYSTPWCGYCHRLKSQLRPRGHRLRRWSTSSSTPRPSQIVEQANNGNQTVPTLVFADGSAQTNPSLAQVKQKLAALA